MSDMWIQLIIMMFQDHGQCYLDEHQKANVCVCTGQGWRLQLHNQQLHSIWLYYCTTCRGEQTDPMMSACLKKINAIMRLGGRITWEDMNRVENAVATCKRASSGNCQHVHQVQQKTSFKKNMQQHMHDQSNNRIATAPDKTHLIQHLDKHHLVQRCTSGALEYYQGGNGEEMEKMWITVFSNSTNPMSSVDEHLGRPWSVST